MRYKDYLASDKWKRKRDEARKRARNRCRICKSTENLNTHHKTYVHVGKERQHELVVLCREHHIGCHEFIKDWRDRGYKPISDYALTMKYVYRTKKKLELSKARARRKDEGRQ